MYRIEENLVSYHILHSAPLGCRRDPNHQGRVGWHHVAGTLRAAWTLALPHGAESHTAPLPTNSSPLPEGTSRTLYTPQGSVPHQGAALVQCTAPNSRVLRRAGVTLHSTLSCSTILGSKELSAEAGRLLHCH